MANRGNVVYAENEHPRMGILRKSFHRNALLVKPKLGTTRKVSTPLPDEAWIYGVCNEPDPEGVREVLVHKENNTRDRERKGGHDILAMNKLAAIKHANRACEQRIFRKKHLIRLHVRRKIGKSPLAKLPSEIDRNYIYGQPGLKNDEMRNIMEHAYANEWIKMNMHHQHEYHLPKPIFIPPKTSNSAQLREREIHRRTHPLPPKERFILSKFKVLTKKIDNVNHIPLKRD